ncbi:MAG: hypothetical protein IT518_20375 [Burkholderiales bacterium]|nr:hypothetical protein [Burkholderiales bacterium]
MDRLDQSATPPATPFDWPRSNLEPLPWFPFTVAASRGHDGVAGRLALRAERAYRHLRKLLAFTPRFRLLVLDRRDWPRFAEVETYGIAHFTQAGNLVLGAAPADAWRDIARELARKLPAPALGALTKVHGRDLLYAHAPDLRGVSDALIAHEIARLLLDQAGARFPRGWMKDAFANYALVAVLGETDPTGLHRIGTLAEATRALAAITPAASALRAGLAPFHAMLVQLALTRAAYEAYADAQDAPLARWFALVTRMPPEASLRAASPQGAEHLGAALRCSIAPDADHELGRMLTHEVHAAIGALVTDDPPEASLRAAAPQGAEHLGAVLRCSAWHQPVAQAA